MGLPGIGKFERIADEIIHELAKLERDDIGIAEAFGFYDRALFFQGFPDIFFYIIYDQLQIGPYEPAFFGGIDTGVGQQHLL